MLLSKSAYDKVPDSSNNSFSSKLILPPRIDNDVVDEVLISPNRKGDIRNGNNATKAPGSRTDVKETLKSMGLRCEDFTISVYSKEQAHAILKKQNLETSDIRKGKNNATVTSKPSKPPPQNTKTESSPVEEDDDDDCVILEPPVEKRTVPRPMIVKRPMAPHRQGVSAARYSKQFQLMGTTVQVNSRRGTKRSRYEDEDYVVSNKRMLRDRSYQHHHMPPHYYQSRRERHYHPRNYPYLDEEDYSDDESPSEESSVQDTLNRLKNYNISITCRRNEMRNNRSRANMDSRGRDAIDHRRFRDNKHNQVYVNNLASDSEEFDYDSEEEGMGADMAKFVECQIADDELLAGGGRRRAKSGKGSGEKEEAALNESLDSSGVEIIDKGDEEEDGELPDETEEKTKDDNAPSKEEVAGDKDTQSGGEDGEGTKEDDKMVEDENTAEGDAAIEHQEEEGEAAAKEEETETEKEDVVEEKNSEDHLPEKESSEDGGSGEKTTSPPAEEEKMECDATEEEPVKEEGSGDEEEALLLDNSTVDGGVEEQVDEELEKELLQEGESK